MGLPVTSTYIIVSALGASALGELGASLLAAHLVIFWFAQTATITPPVCMTAFVAGSMAGAPAMRTGFESMWVGKALYLVPLMFPYTNVLSPSVWKVVLDVSAGLLALVFLLVVMEGYFKGPMGTVGRIVAAVASACLLSSAFQLSASGTLVWMAAGFILVGGLYVAQQRRSTGTGAAPVQRVTS
jgi:TRAP-type uncharacterized transport system fused permease subunit